MSEYSIDNIGDIQKLYDFWFAHPDHWFNTNQANDLLISKSFAHLFEAKVNEELLISNKKYAIGVILLYDQISRHVLRVNPDFLNLDIVSTLSNKYYSIVWDNWKSELSADEFCFVMLVLRHKKDFIEIKFVMQETWLRLETCSSTEQAVYKRFLKATYERAVKQTNIDLDVKFYEKKLPDHDTSVDIIKEKYKKILDIKCFDSIDISFDIKQMIILTVKTQLMKLENKKFILSISGGVDSMICSYILKKLKYDFCCVHINYSNRPVSEQEEQFVIDWCNLIGVDLYVRKIEEISRPKCMKWEMRDTYENYTRNVRYSTYVSVFDLYSTNQVILGHNSDDCFENILTNITKKSKYENLFGMEFSSEIHFKKSINFIRPMLTIEKKLIYQIAICEQIPFLLDSTPEWSQRGKIRDIVRPVLESWDVDLIDGLFKVSECLQETNQIVNLYVSSWIEKMEDLKIQALRKDIPTSKLFWKLLFKKLNIKCSSQSLECGNNFIIRFVKNKIKLDINTCIKYEVNKNTQIELKLLKDDYVKIHFNIKK